MRTIICLLFLLAALSVIAQNKAHTIVVEELIEGKWYTTSIDTITFDKQGRAIEAVYHELYYDSCKCILPEVKNRYFYSADGTYSVRYNYKWSTRTNSYYLNVKEFNYKRPGFILIRFESYHPTSRDYFTNRVCIIENKYDEVCTNTVFDIDRNEVTDYTHNTHNAYHSNGSIAQKTSYYSYKEDDILITDYDMLGRKKWDGKKNWVHIYIYNGADTLPYMEKAYDCKDYEIDSIPVEEYYFTYNNTGDLLTEKYVSDWPTYDQLGKENGHNWQVRLRRKYYYK